MLTDQLQTYFSAAEADQTFSGVVLLRRAGDLLFQGSYGYAQRGWQIRNGPETRFRVASVGKLFTAVTILQLIEEGLLALETPVVDLLGLAETRIPTAVTVYHLLTMTSGIADWFDESGDWEANWAALIARYPIYQFRQNADYLPLFINESPVSAVGEKYHYNGAGYILLGLIIEKLTGQSYFEVVRERVFQRAGMAQSDFLALDGVHEHVAEGYVPLEDEAGQITGWQKNIYRTTPEAAADGGASATAGDLVRFLQALRNGRLLSPAMTQLILTPQVPMYAEKIRGYSWRYGLANMFLEDDVGQIIRYGHTGEEDGVSVRLYHYPAHNLDVVILANQSWASGKAGWEVHRLIVEQ